MNYSIILNIILNSSSSSSSSSTGLLLVCLIVVIFNPLCIAGFDDLGAGILQRSRQERKHRCIRLGGMLCGASCHIRSSLLQKVLFATRMLVVQICLAIKPAFGSTGLIRGVKLLTEDRCHSISSRSLRYLLAQPHQNDTLLRIPKPIAICQPTLGITAAHDQTNNCHLGLCEARARSLSLSLYYIIY